MGEYKAGTTILFLFIYFIIFIFVVDSVSTSIDSQGYNISATEQDLSSLSINNLCDSPRYRYDPTTGESKPFTGGYLALLDCDNSKGVLSSTDCNAIEGCSWENVTSGFWWWTSIEEGCTGTINASYYGVETETGLFGKDVVAEFNESSYYTSEDETSANVCRHPEVSLNQTKCDLFSCTWEEYDITGLYSNPSSIVGTMGDVFSFRYDFGIENGMISWFLRLIFIIIPLIALIINIYFMIPVIH